jgi:long-chain acyl-CoA synthetase
MRPYPWEQSYPAGVDWGAPIDVFTLPALLDQSVARFGDLPALRFRATRLSFVEFGARVDRLAAGLIAEGLHPGQSVGLFLPNTPYHPIAFFAVLRAGGRVVHLSPLDPVRALARKLADSAATWVIATDVPALLPTAQRLAAEGYAERVFIGADAAWDGDAPHGLPDSDPPSAWPVVTADDVALLQYTGGTTGVPRAAMLTHANLSAAVSIYRVWNDGQGRNMSPADRVICVLPLFHIYALTAVMLRSIADGAELLLMARFDAATLIDAIENQHATVFAGVPTMWTALAQFPGIETRDLSSLRVASSGGAPLPVEIAARIEALTGHKLGGGWGMTETSPAGTNLLPGTTMAPGAIGLPLPGIVMRVVSLDDPSRALSPGETGEIAIRGPNVTAGYWNRAEETAQAFADGFFLTGDVGYMAEDGQFYLVDRKKDMILSGGFNVYPRIIEDAIYEHPDVAEAAVVGIPDEYRGQAAKAFVTMRPGADALTLEALRGFLADRIGRHELPQALEIRQSLPKTAVGKLSRRDLSHPPSQEI